MNHLIIFAHPQQSLNQTLLDLVVSTLLNNGHQVTVRDVYALGFSPELNILEKACLLYTSRAHETLYIISDAVIWL
ncbi:NAD(P)H-dependent oxidoreductase [Bacillus pumilus]